MKKFINSIVILLMLASTSLMASELTAPKNNGIIGERFDGYVAVVKNASPKIKALVASVNQKRKARYQQIAKKRNQPLNQVELIAGKATIKKTAKGNFIFLKGVGWKKK